MISISNRLYVGSEKDYALHASGSSRRGWAVVHAAKEPYHREFVGYSTAGAPKDSPEYLWAFRDLRLALNLIDVNDPSFISPDMINVAVVFARKRLEMGDAVLVHCNEGYSRGPTVGMLVMAPELSENFLEAAVQFNIKCWTWNPKQGIYQFARDHWKHYHGK